MLNPTFHQLQGPVIKFGNENPLTSSGQFK